MRNSGRLSAAIEILEDFEARRVPLKTALADWARGARYAGAKDRAWISGLCLDVLRRRNWLGFVMEDASPRAAALGAMRFLWNVAPGALKELAGEEPHGPGGLSEPEDERLAGDFDSRMAVAPLHIVGDLPEWLAPHMARVFGETAAGEAAALSRRADVDLRINTIKTDIQKALIALKPVRAESVPMLTSAARIAAPDPAERAPAVTVIPAYSKGWVEVQDLGSQIAAAAAGAIKGVQVLDYCAGGGGKTLALAALMENTGQIYAYDQDARRLKPLYERAKRAGVRNLQVRNPASGEMLDDLAEKLDVVFVDAPCTGSGTWRRHPDSKWRLTPQQLERRIAEQDAVLGEAARFVKPGGRLVYVTCSVFMEENEDRLDAFLAGHEDFTSTLAMEAVEASGLLTADGKTALERCITPGGALRLTPARLSCDGFFISVLQRR